MRLYAIRDRLLNYFMQPFAGPDDKAVLASIASHINTREATDAIAQAPHHFEIWRVAEVGDQGEITANKEFLADCHSLIRGNVRTGNITGAPTDGRTHTGIESPSTHNLDLTGTYKRPAAPAPAEPALERTQTPPKAGGVPAADH